MDETRGKAGAIDPLARATLIRDGWGRELIRGARPRACLS
jgi:hypothetical protein